MKAPYAGAVRRPAPADAPKSGRMPQAVPYLRKLRQYVASTPDITARGVIDKIDDLIWQARGGK